MKENYTLREGYQNPTNKLNGSAGSSPGRLQTSATRLVLSVAFLLIGLISSAAQVNPATGNTAYAYTMPVGMHTKTTANSISINTISTLFNLNLGRHCLNTQTRLRQAIFRHCITMQAAHASGSYQKYYISYLN